MIQLNLLPDVKLDYLKARRARRLVTTISILVSSVAIAILVILLVVDFVQKAEISGLNNKIQNESNTLQNEPGINQVLTVQNQLESLTALHEAKPAATRLFDTYLNQITPATASLSSLNIDFTKKTIILTGSADNLSTVNKYVDTIKLTNYSLAGNSNMLPAFSSVVLTSFGLDSASTNKNSAASFTINLAYDQAIFDNTKNVTLSVPTLTANRSQVPQPTALFNGTAPPNSKSSQTGGAH